MKRNLTIVMIVLCLGLLAAGTALAATGQAAVPWRVLSGGGAAASAALEGGGEVRLNASLGQSITGASSGGQVGLQAGFWLPQSSGAGDYRVMLPVVAR